MPPLQTTAHERYRYAAPGVRAVKLRLLHAASGRIAKKLVRYLPGLEKRHDRLVALAPGVRIWRLPAAAAQPHYGLTDRTGSVTAELDAAGHLISAQTCYPFGGGAAWAARSRPAAARHVRRYAGKEHDDSGLLDYGFRLYAPWLMRWLNPDPAGTLDGLNLFRMVRNNPVTLTDPDGRAPEPTDNDLAELARQMGVELTPQNRRWLENIYHLMSPPPAVPVTFSLSATPAAGSSAYSSITASVTLPEETVLLLDNFFAGMADGIHTLASSGLTAAPAGPAAPRQETAAPQTDAGAARPKSGKGEATPPPSSGQEGHERTCSPAKPYCCRWPGCEIRRAFHSQLIQHERIHTGERPYTCSQPGCNKTFKHTFNLYKHERTDHNVRPHVCDWPGCSRGFNFKRDLTHHRSVHTGGPPYVCDWPGCNRIFPRLERLRTHQNPDKHH